MTVHGAQLAPEGSGVGTLALGPGRAGLDDEALAAVQAVGVGVGVGIVLCEAGLVLRLVRVGRGGRDEGRVLGEGRLGGKLKAGLAKLEEGLGDIFYDQGKS